MLQVMLKLWALISRSGWSSNLSIFNKILKYSPLFCRFLFGLGYLIMKGTHICISSICTFQNTVVEGRKIKAYDASPYYTYIERQCGPESTHIYVFLQIITMYMQQKTGA
jgi:hypothetical protein